MVKKSSSEYQRMRRAISEWVAACSIPQNSIDNIYFDAMVDSLTCGRMPTVSARQV